MTKLWVNYHRIRTGISQNYEWTITKLWVDHHKIMGVISQFFMSNQDKRRHWSNTSFPIQMLGWGLNTGMNQYLMCVRQFMLAITVSCESPPPGRKGFNQFLLVHTTPPISNTWITGFILHPRIMIRDIRGPGNRTLYTSLNHFIPV